MTDQMELPFEVDTAALTREFILAVEVERQPASRMRTGRHQEEAAVVYSTNVDKGLSEKVFKSFRGQTFEELATKVSYGTASAQDVHAFKMEVSRKKTAQETVSRDSFTLARYIQVAEAS